MTFCVVGVALIAALVSCQVRSGQAVNPGFRTILTQRGLDYVNQIGFPLLKEKLCNLTIPTITGSSKVGIITVDYTVSNLVIKSLNFGDSSLTSDSRGVVLTDDGISLSISADWSYKEDGWPHLKDHGSVDISASGISLSVSVDVKANKTDGHMQLNSTGCSFNIDTIKVDFHGGASWLYNLFSSAIEGVLRKQIDNKVCKKANKEINTLGNTVAGSLPVLLPVGYGMEISYALVSDPDFSHNGCIVTNHKGEFLQIATPQDPPFTPPPFPDPSNYNDSKMIYVIASKYVAESASYAFWKAGLMVYNISSEQMPPGFGVTTAFCSIVSPELCKRFPNKRVMFGIVASDYPKVIITKDYAVMQAKVSASMYVNNDKSMELAFTLALSVQADVTISLRHNKTTEQYFITGNISNPRINVSLAKSNIGNFNCSNLKVLITTFAPTLGLDYVNNYTNAGFPIPMAEGISFIDPKLKFGVGYIEVGSDVLYSQKYLKKLRGMWQHALV